YFHQPTFNIYKPKTQYTFNSTNNKGDIPAIDAFHHSSSSAGISVNFFINNFTNIFLFSLISSQVLF
ncbi:hypothetical protein ACFL1L_05720, partial [Thermoplasmatota archaeon]